MTPVQLQEPQLNEFVFKLNAWNHLREIKDHSPSLSRRRATVFILLFLNLVHHGLFLVLFPSVLDPLFEMVLEESLPKNRRVLINWTFRKKVGIVLRKRGKIWGSLICVSQSGTVTKTSRLFPTLFCERALFGVVGNVGDPYDQRSLENGFYVTVCSFWTEKFVQSLKVCNLCQLLHP